MSCCGNAPANDTQETQQGFLYANKDADYKSNLASLVTRYNNNGLKNVQVFFTEGGPTRTEVETAISNSGIPKEVFRW